MTGKDAPPEVKIRSYRDSPICDVVVVVHGTEMVLRCPDYSQATRWARLERKSYKIPEPDIDVAAKAESRELPLFLRGGAGDCHHFAQIDRQLHDAAGPKIASPGRDPRCQTPSPTTRSGRWCPSAGRSAPGHSAAGWRHSAVVLHR